MFSTKFSNIINRVPSSAQALDLVAKYLDSAEEQKRLHKLRLDPNLIQRISGVNTSSELAVLISLLTSEHILRRVVVVESPAGGGVAEYSSVEEIPDSLHDHLRDVWMDVTPSDLRTVYVAET
jgi:Iap family predicted aminopeptidase